MIKKLAYNIEKRIDILKYKQEQKFINNFVTLHGYTAESPALRELLPARKTLANYLADDGLAIDIYAPTKENEKNLTLKLTDLFRGKSTARLIDADITKTHTHSIDDYFVIDYPHDGIQLVRKTKHESDDNFLRHIFRQIVNMKDELKNIRP